MNVVMNRHRRHCNAHRQLGLAALEFAIVLPVLLLLLLVTAELGRVMFQYNTLTKSVGAGARYLAANALPGTTGVISISAEVEATARNLVVFGSPGGGGTPLLPGLSTGAVSVVQTSATHVRVSAEYAYAPLFSEIPVFGLATGSITVPATLRALAEMRAL
jgi:Flp pilus assembly protein TadG